MTLIETIARMRAAHLMVRDAKEWDGLATGLLEAYAAKDEDLVEQLQSPFLQSWRTVTRYVLRDTFDQAGILVGEPSDPWGIAVLTTNGRSAEPLLCLADRAELQGAGTPNVDGRRLMTFSEVMTHYSECLEPLFAKQSA
ncbi:hypothetical protein LN996_18505 [Arthrobacter sp. AK01]|uniref:hypothetical protein n=1 Tax=Arthrobacter sp. AK01 TaxID=2894084 RepID=UPI001E4DABB3|nr:hypothetical protein [Arthrobacter sp. AK01]MCD4852811.1 hypothetical protein [Arthrobacter sp. AK01]